MDTQINGTRWFRKRIGLALLLAVALGPAGANTPDYDIRRDATVMAIDRVSPSVVNIRTSKLVRRNTPEEEILRRYFGWKVGGSGPAEEQINSIGSGVIVEATEDEAYILTNFHVLNQAERVQVQLWDGREYEAEKLLRTALKDLALLRIVRQPGDAPFQTVTLARDDDLLLGETVIALGNPFGLGSTVTRGILSAKNRRSAEGYTPLDFPDWLQTDADINPGNSGGPLINLRGELIGINVAVYDEPRAKGVGFAIPVRQISEALSDFFTLEWNAKLWLGARFRGAPYPLTVREIQPGSPADRAGLKVGQQVVAVNGRPVQTLAGLSLALATPSDRRSSVTVLEGGERRTVNVELVPLTNLNQDLILRRLGITASLLTESQAAEYQLASGEGWLIREVEPGSPGAAARLEPGFVITKIDNISASDPVNTSNVLGNKQRGESVQLTVKVVSRYGGRYVRVMTGQVDVAVR